MSTVLLPFGELFIEERTTWNTPYKFSGKELDEETGYSYFGARYYDPNISIWLSVDPLSDKYPGLSAYAYTANNPIRFIDPDGMALGDPPALVKGWNRQVSSFNDNFYSSVNARIDNPGLLTQDLNDAATGLLTLMCDVTGISNAVTGQNSTADAIMNVGETLGGIPNMSGEERGALAAQVMEAGVVMAATKRVPGQKVRLRHYTNQKGISGIRRGRGSNYVEYDAYDSEFSIYKNPKTGTKEYNIKGDVDLNNRNPRYYKNE
jgi:RHS repeat-associated protein